jgi:hypothetical protein
MEMGKRVLTNYLTILPEEKDIVIRTVRSLPSWQQWLARKSKALFRLLAKEEMYRVVRKHSHKFGYDTDNRCGFVKVNIWYEFGNGEIADNESYQWLLKNYEEIE